MENSAFPLGGLISHPVGMIFVIIGLGKLLGSIRINGASLGTSGILFVALLFGALGYSTPAILGTLGLVLFSYSIGLSAGPSFFRIFASQGLRLAILSLVIVLTGALATFPLAWILDIPVGLAAGAFTGALTTTPGLAASLEMLPDNPALSIGYGIAYPVGVVTVVLFAQLMPRWYRKTIQNEEQEAEKEKRSIQRLLVEISNPVLEGRRISEVPFLGQVRGQIARIQKEGQLEPIGEDIQLHVGQVVLIVGDSQELESMVDFLGIPCNDPFVIDLDTQRSTLIVTSRDWVGKSLRNLRLPNRFGAVVTRITRHEISFVPTLDTVLHNGDQLLVVGRPGKMKEMRESAGHRKRVLQETDLLGIAFGITLGVALGLIPFHLLGTTFRFGMAGGPLFVGLLLEHFGGIGKIRIHVPPAARILMSEIGLSFFLLSAGLDAGQQLLPVLRDNGLLLLPMAFIIDLVSLIAGFVVARKLLKISVLQSIGGICGGMTSTPGLGAITQQTDSPVPSTSYSAAYPVALIVITLVSQLLIMAMMALL